MSQNTSDATANAGSSQLKGANAQHSIFGTPRVERSNAMLRLDICENDVLICSQSVPDPFHRTVINLSRDPRKYSVWSRIAYRARIAFAAITAQRVEWRVRVRADPKLWAEYAQTEIANKMASEHYTRALTGTLPTLWSQA